MIDKIIAQCSNCNLSHDIEKCNIICDKCHYEKIIHIEDIMDAIKVSAKTYCAWEDEEIHFGHNSKEEMRSFIRGIKHGFHISLYEISEYFDKLDFFEKEIEPLFEK